MARPVKASDEDIIKQSAVKLDTPTFTTDKGALYDERMGVIDNDKKCKTCDQDPKECPGHMGHIDLNENISHSFENEGMAFFIEKCTEINGVKPVGIIKKSHGHKGSILVKPLNCGSKKMLGLKNVTIVDKYNNRVKSSVYDIRKYRRGEYLIKLCELKWRSDVESLKNHLILA